MPAGLRILLMPTAGGSRLSKEPLKNRHCVDPVSLWLLLISAALAVARVFQSFPDALGASKFSDQQLQ
jgi:hypothetical protein